MAVATSHRRTSVKPDRPSRDRDPRGGERRRYTSALATAALESAVATLYASALASCSISGPSSVTRALTADWRASAASSLIRTGQALYTH